MQLDVDVYMVEYVTLHSLTFMREPVTNKMSPLDESVLA